jgi:ABC-type multidrug transport system fused ATPase/permease subunit
MRDENVHYADSVSDLLRITQELRVLNVEDAYAAQVRRAIRRTSREYFRNVLLTKLVPALYQGVALLLVVLALAAVAAVGADDVLGLGAVVLLLVRALNYGNILQSSYQQLNDLVPYAQHIRQELEAFERDRVVDGDQPITRVGRVTFDHVAFGYGEGPRVLHDLSFAIEPGECIGIVGPSGAGKSTIIQLLLRLRHPDEGEIASDGVPLRSIARGDWYRCIGYVPQDPALIVGTVAENIRFYRDGISDEAVERAARRAHLHDDVERMPGGYDTLIGPRDNTISGGQRQRLCIARALATDPTLIVLDEPTSALDGRSEQAIRVTLEEMKGEVTLVIIAHRMSTLTLADRIMVLEHGELKAFHPASELHEHSDFFREMLRASDLAGPRET